jgi:hypothetical protein
MFTEYEVRKTTIANNNQDRSVSSPVPVPRPPFAQRDAGPPSKPDRRCARKIRSCRMLLSVNRFSDHCARARIDALAVARDHLIERGERVSLSTKLAEYRSLIE